MQIATVRTGFPFANIYMRTNYGIGGEYLKAGDVDDCGGSYGCKSEILSGSCGRNVRFLGWESFAGLLTGTVSRPLEMKATASASTCFRA